MQLERQLANYSNQLALVASPNRLALSRHTSTSAVSMLTRIISESHAMI
jgi:hypothetical protein